MSVVSIDRWFRRVTRWGTMEAGAMRPRQPEWRLCIGAVDDFLVSFEMTAGYRGCYFTVRRDARKHSPAHVFVRALGS